MGEEASGMSREAIEHGMAMQIQDRMRRIVDPDELAHRISLMKAREHACEMVLRTQTQDADDHAANARDIANAFLYSECPPERLARAVSYCRLLVQCAGAADALGG